MCEKRIPSFSSVLKQNANPIVGAGVCALMFTCSEAQKQTKVGRGWGREGGVHGDREEEPEANV